MDVLIHYNPWSLFVMVIVKQISLVDWKELMTLQKNVEIQIFHITRYLSREY